MIKSTEEANTRHPDASESYIKGRMMLEVYLAQIKAQHE